MVLQAVSQLIGVFVGIGAGDLWCGAWLAIRANFPAPSVMRSL